MFFQVLHVGMMCFSQVKGTKTQYYKLKVPVVARFVDLIKEKKINTSFLSIKTKQNM